MADAKRLVVLDIGETLVTGPETGPARRIATPLGLTRAQARELHVVLMTTDFAVPDAVAEHVAREFAVDARRARDVARDVWHAQRSESRLVSDALNALSALAGQDDLMLAVLSNIWRPYLESARDHLGAWMDAHIPLGLQQFSFLTGRAKPERVAFMAVLGAAGVGQENAVMVGDNYGADIVGAARAGLRTVWVVARPDREVDDMVRVLDGAAPAPDRAVRSIASVTPETIHGLWPST